MPWLNCECCDDEFWSQSGERQCDQCVSEAIQQAEEDDDE